MSYGPPPVMIVVHPWHARALAALVSEDLLARTLQKVPPEARSTVLASHRGMAAQVHWIAAQRPADDLTPDPPLVPLQAVSEPPEPPPEWISTAAASDLIGIEPRSVRYAADKGSIRSRQDRDGGPLFIDRASAEEYRDRRAAREDRAA